MPYKTAFQDLQSLLQDRITTQTEILAAHSRDLSWHSAPVPQAVCFPSNTEEVAEIVKICNIHKIPIIPYGTGTSLEGHILAMNGGITLDLSRMNRILDCHVIDEDCRVEAGVTKFQLNNYLKDKGLFFAAGPGIDASMGGMMATGASGANAVMYGTVKENVRALKVVTGEGKIVRTRRRVRKSSAGYDLTQLFVGSEGTLGVITEVTAVLRPLPLEVAVGVVSFSSVQQAINAAIRLNQSHLPLAMLELMDEVIIDAINRYSGTDYPVQPALFLELHCSEIGKLEEYYETIERIVSDYQAGAFDWTMDTESKAKLSKVRYDAVYAAKALRPEAAIWSTDVTVPISRLAEIIVETKKDLEQQRIPMPLFGHVGDGNFHTVLLCNPNDDAEIQIVKQINHRIVERALAMEGTCTGEHGIGVGKKDYLEQEFGLEGIGVMKAIKKALDPNGIMNPGKVL